METIVALALVVVGLATAAWLRGRWSVYNMAARLPGRRWALPIVGHTYLFFGYDQESLFGRLRSALYAEFNELPCARLWLGPQLVAVITDADYVEKVIFNRALLHKGDLLHAADKIVGNGLLFGSGPDVKRRRRGILPSMKMRMLEQYLKVFHRHSQILQQVLIAHVVDEKEICLEKYLHHCIFDAVNETTIGARTNCQGGRNGAMVQDLIDVYSFLYQEIMKPWLYHGCNALRMLGYRFRMDHIIDMLDRHIGAALERKKAELQSKTASNLIKSKTNCNCTDNESMQDGSNKNSGTKINKVFETGAITDHGAGYIEDTSNQNGGTTRDDAVEEFNQDRESYPEIMSTLEFMLQSDFEISDQDLIMEMKNIFMASSDTVAQTCAFLFKMLAIHPEYQERAYREVAETLGSPCGGAPSAAQLARLDFLECCIKETLRLFPIAPFLPRKTEEPLRLDDKLTLDTGTSVLVGAFWLHRSPRHWRHPHAFHPNHFAPQEQVTRHRAAFIPFSGGAHSCIGQQYAMWFMKILAAMVLLEFRVEPVDSDYVTCRFGHGNSESTQNGGIRNGGIQNDGTQNGGFRKVVTQNGDAKNGCCKNESFQNGDARQNGGDVKSSSEFNKGNATRTTIEWQSNESLPTKTSYKVIDKLPCPRDGCTGRYIPEDYVANMNLGIDISIRLVGGIFVKMYRRNKKL